MKAENWFCALSIIFTLSFVIDISDCYITQRHSFIDPDHLKEEKFQYNKFKRKENTSFKSIVKDPRLESNEEKRWNFLHKDYIGNDRIHSSYFFPIFPQFYDVDYNDVWNFLKNTDTIIFFVAVHLIETFVTIGIWIILHSLIWDGELPVGDARDENLGFPLNMISHILKGHDIAPLNINENELKIDKKEYVKSIESQSEEISEKTAIRKHSLAEISLNNLYNLLVNPRNSATSLTFSFWLDFIIMAMWLLPTFLWNGEALDETDRPFKGLDKDPQDILSRGSHHLDHMEFYHRNNYNVYWPKPKQDTKPESRFVKLYNKLLCPQCVARQFTIQGVILAAKLVFFSFMGLLPREDFPPKIITPSPLLS